jgi:hypothetical protein
MKKFLSCMFILSCYNCYAGTGGAKDGILFILSVMGILLLLLSTGYFLDFLKTRIKDARTRRLLKRDSQDHDGEFIDSWAEGIPRLDGISDL